jgi:SAM-dependent methyltransferase
MERLALLRFLENVRLGRHIRGQGVEIGALWRRFPLSGRASAWYVDRLDRDELKAQYPELSGRILKPDLLADAVDLPFPSASLRFLIASHVLEHLPFPLAALRSWYNVLAPGGVLLLRVPDKRYTFDRGRDRTPLGRLSKEDDNPQLFEPRRHYADWVERVGGIHAGRPEFDATVDDLIRRDYSIHFHVWIDEDIREIVNLSRGAWNCDWDAVAFWKARFYRKETTVLLRRRGAVV